MGGRSVRFWLAGIVGLGAVLRFAVYSAAVGHPGRFWSPDDYGYLPIARHLRQAYGSGPGPLFDKGLQRPPVYPLFLRGIFDVFGYHYAAVVAVQIVVSLLTILLVYWIARRFVTEGFALLAALVVACDPASILFVNQMMTDTLFAFIITASVALLVLAWERVGLWWALLAGVVLGLATLTRPLTVYLPIALLPALLLPKPLALRSRLLLTGLLIVGFILPVGGWIARNHHVTGVATISTIEGLNMTKYNAVDALVQEGMSHREAAKEVRDQVLAELPANANAGEVAKTRLHVGERIMLHHPKGTIKSWVKGEFHLLSGPGKAELAILLTGNQSSSKPWVRLLEYLAALYTVLFVLVAAVGLVVLVIGPTRTTMLWVMATIVVYLTLVSGGPVAYARFRVPITPFLAVFVAFGVARLVRARAPRRRTELSPQAGS